MGFLSKLGGIQRYVALFVFAINITSFLIFGLDKFKAKRGHYRISEFNLILLSLIGGGVGAIIGMVIFRHKLSKPKFRLGVPLIIVLNYLSYLYLFGI